MSQTATVTSNAEEFNQALRAYVRVYTRGGRSLTEAIGRQGYRFTQELSDGMKHIAPTKGSIREDILSGFKAGIGLRIHDRKVTQVGLDRPMTLTDVVNNRVFGWTKSRSGRIGGKKQQFWKDQYRGRKGDILDHFLNTSAGSKTGGALGKYKKAAKRMALQSMYADLEIKYREKAIGFLAFAVRFKGQMDKSSRLSGRNRMEQSVTLAESIMRQSGNATELAIIWSDSFSSSSGGIAAALQKPAAAQIVDATLRSRTSDMMKYVEDRMAKDWAKA